MLEAFPDSELDVSVVWLKMLPTDTPRAAARTGRMFAGSRVRQFYDPARIVGTTYMRDVFPNCIHDALQATPLDHPMRSDLEEWARGPAGESPLWDAVLFYPSGVEWGSTAPQPLLWAKQVGFFPENDDGQPTGIFWHHVCKSAPVDSDWQWEVRDAMQQLMKGP